MSDVIKVLQLGDSDWRLHYKMPAGIEFHYLDVFEKVPKEQYDITFIDRLPSEEEIQLLQKAVKAHTLYVTETVTFNECMAEFFLCRLGKRLAVADIQEFLLNEVRNYFPTPYGEKFEFNNLAIAQGFSGDVSWNGKYSVNLQGEYGEELSQIAFWRNNIPVFQGQAIELWLEYEKDPDVEIALSVTQFKRGTISEVQQKWFFGEKELDELVIIDNKLSTGFIFVSLLARGKGKLKIIALHDRYSRRGHGVFLPGGERFVSSKREEIFYYFDPGDRKPPLNVFFSGYKTRQGFEGYNMMRKFGSPFLLIGESRLDGGSFYMGSEDYEQGYIDIIQKHMEALGFSSKQVILSGISMGSFAALYYGCDILPHAMIVGKPLINIGGVAENERIHRPGGFPTSLDVLNYLCGGMDKDSIERINEFFWRKFKAADWGKSKFILSYMIEDDYDRKAYDMILSNLNSGGVQVYGKGIHGRHNDASGLIVGWFRSQYEKILYEDFGRKGK